MTGGRTGHSWTGLLFPSQGYCRDIFRGNWRAGSTQPCLCWQISPCKCPLSQIFLMAHCPSQAQNWKLAWLRGGSICRKFWQVQEGLRARSWESSSVGCSSSLPALVLQMCHMAHPMLTVRAYHPCCSNTVPLPLEEAMQAGKWLPALYSFWAGWEVIPRWGEGGHSPLDPKFHVRPLA